MITAIDPHTALILIDLQKGILSAATAHPVSEIIANSARLIAAFKAKALPVVIVNVNPVGSPAMKTRSEQSMLPKDEAGQQKALDGMIASGFFDIVPEIQAGPDDIMITKHCWNAFADTPLHELLKTRGITGIVLGGVATSIGVESTARAANEKGYNISFATDAMTDRILEAHQHSQKIIFPRIGESGTTNEIIEVLNRS